MTVKTFSGRLLTAILAAFLFNGCSQDEPQNFETCFDNIKNQDESEVDCGGICPFQCPAKMTAKINNSPWTADTSNLEVSYNSGSSTLRITGRTKSTFYPTITLVYIGPISPGQHNLNNSTSYTPDFTSPAYFSNSGTINFSNADSHDRILNGTFSFTCSDQGGNTATISEGVFENLAY